jgi:hypothetical protein
LGATWWAHFELPRINIEPGVLRKKIPAFVPLACHTDLDRCDDGRQRIGEPRKIPGAESAPQLHVSGVDSAAILSLVRDIRAELERIQAPATTRAEVETDLQTIELQAPAAKPKWRIVRESILSARGIVETLIASEIFAKLQALLGGLPN